MSIRKKLYNPIFEEIVFKYADPNDLVKEGKASIITDDSEDYVFIQDLLDRFKISRHDLLKTLKMLEIEPAGLKHKVKNGRRANGPPRIVYHASVIDTIYNSVSVSDIKEKAFKILGDEWSLKKK